MSNQATVLRWTVLVLGVAALWTLMPLWVPLLFAVWFATLAAPVLSRLRFLGGRQRAAAGLTVALLLGFMIPIAGAAISLGASGVDLAQQIAASEGGREALTSIVSGGNGQPEQIISLDPQHLFQLVQSYGGQAWKLLSALAGAATKALVGLFIFAAGAYVFLVDGDKTYSWMRDHLPLDPEHTDRLGSAAVEVGRGLVVSVGLTSLIQGTVAGITYLALGIPRAFSLWVLTCFAALIPSVGAALVWVPIAAGLALTGRTVAAIVLSIIGVALVGSIDNILRPYLSRYGQLKMPMFLVMVGMFGGFAVFGAWGIALGPLLLRLAVEALEIAKDKHLFRDP